MTTQPQRGPNALIHKVGTQGEPADTLTPGDWALLWYEDQPITVRIAAVTEGPDDTTTLLAFTITPRPVDAQRIAITMPARAMVTRIPQRRPRRTQGAA